MKILGTEHQSNDYNAFITEVLSEIGKSGTKVSVGIEVEESIASNTPFWRRVIRTTNEYCKAQNVACTFHYLDTPMGNKIAFRTVKNTASPGLPYRNRQGWERGLYVIDRLRTKMMARSIQKVKPDIVLCGNVHALLLGKLLKIKPKHIGATEKEIRDYYFKERQHYTKVRKERILRRQQRRLAARKANKHS